MLTFVLLFGLFRFVGIKLCGVSRGVLEMAGRIPDHCKPHAAISFTDSNLRLLSRGTVRRRLDATLIVFRIEVRVTGGMDREIALDRVN